MDSYFYCIQDGLFDSDSLEIINEKIRALILLKLNLSKDIVTLDIEAGKIGASIDIARYMKSGFVYTIENNDDAVKMIRKNCEKFEIRNLQIIKGETRDIIKELSGFERIFIDADISNFSEILEISHSNLKTEGRVVLYSDDEKLSANVDSFLKNKKYKEIEITSSEKIEQKNKTRFAYIISAKKSG